uniref:small G protein signaling modulator 2-like n=1 Tax=Solea senegalensis TaxID=28829 RepID=UPI001CD8531F|nr:small G protein signaling modulator 2-like [Solea senegalensis]
MVASKARISKKQYMKDKPTRGRVSPPLTISSVWDLLPFPILGGDYRLYVDNYHTSPALFVELVVVGPSELTGKDRGYDEFFGFMDVECQVVLRSPDEDEEVSAGFQASEENLFDISPLKHTAMQKVCYVTIDDMKVLQVRGVSDNYVRVFHNFVSSHSTSSTSEALSSGASPSPSVDWAISFHFRYILFYLWFNFSALFIMSKKLDQNLFDREPLGPPILLVPQCKSSFCFSSLFSLRVITAWSQLCVCVCVCPSGLAYCRHLSTVRTHLSALVNHNIVPPDRPCEASGGLSKEVWSKYQKDCKNYKELELLRLVYYGGVQHDIRKEVWPFLLGHYKFGMGKKDMSQIDAKISERYQQVMREWKACEVIVRQREKEMQSAIFAKLSSGSSIDSHVLRLVHRDSTLSNEVFMSVDEPDAGSQETPSGEDITPTMTTLVPPAALPPEERPLVEFDSPDSGLPSSRNYSVTSAHSQILSSIDDSQSMEEEGGGGEEARTLGVLGGRQDSLTEDRLCSQLDKLVTNGASAEGMSPSLSKYTIELLDIVALNLHRIDKDVQRCDRNYYYFTPANLEKLRNIMCSYVWEHLEMGYVQGMCDLLAPLMVILDDECLAYSCFTQLMKRMSQNFPNGGAMDTHFANMRSLIQILDSELFELMQQNGDYTHFYFCYRWFLLDFKRELLYEDVFAVWEVIWVAPRISSKHFVLFLALALVTVYREIIMDNNMDFTDIIKFFNEMAERHDVQHILKIARELVHKVQSLMDNK